LKEEKMIRTKRRRTVEGLNSLSPHRRNRKGGVRGGRGEVGKKGIARRR